MIDVKDGRGTHKKNERKKNLKIVKDWFEENPGKTAIDCFKDKQIKLAYNTIKSCIRELTKK